MLLTNNQLNALNLTKNISVEANAGSGKTAVLVERFVQILLQTNVNELDSIVGITFTEKAANEIKSRIFKRIEEINEKEKDKYGFHLENILERLSGLKIGTIHSFCNSILHEFSNEIGIDPNFSILQGVDETILLDEAIDESLREIIDLPNNDILREDIIDLVKIFGLYKLRDLIGYLMYQREQVITLNENIYSLNNEEIIKLWNKQLLEFISHLLENNDFILYLYKYKNHWNDKLNNYLKEYFSSDSLIKKCKVYFEIYEIIYTKSGSIRKNFLKDIDPGFEEELLNLNSRINNVPDFIYFIKYYSENKTLDDQVLFQIEISKKILKVFDFTFKKYQNKKDLNAVLDFEDLLIKTRDLLRNENVKNILQKRYKYILVDEYQDTDHLQAEIIYSIIDGNQNTKLFIVGDPKQSIYGFRNAEVEVFFDTEKKIINEKNGEKILLDESFRLLSDLIVFVNYLFKNISNNELLSNVRYKELIKARDNQNTGRVELLLYLENNDLYNYEEEMICRKIISLINSKTQIFDIGSKKPREIEFGDIAILLRSRTRLEILEKTLIKYNIPYLISSGIGYYQTQEIFDLYNYLSFLVNPHNDIALIGILRSPFFYFSDSLLFEIYCASNNNTSLWEKLENYYQKYPENELVNNTINVLRENILFSQRMAFPNLINKILIDSNWYGTLSFQDGGEQVKANLDKFLSIAREYNRLGGCTLFDFVEKLKTLIYEEENEGQAVIDPTNTMVKILTVHASKGLEFPIVFFPYMHQSFKSDSEPYIHKNIGIGFSIPDRNNYDNEYDQTIIAKYIKTINNLKAEAEEKRILYVAITRAHNMLFLSGKYSPSNKHRNYLAFLRDAFKLDNYFEKKDEIKTKDSKNDKESSNPFLDINELTVKDDLTIAYFENEIYKRKKILDYELTIKITQGLKEENEFIDSNKLKISIPTFIPHIESIKSNYSEYILSATAFQTYIECPVKYYLTYSLGFPESILKKQDTKKNSYENYDIYLYDPDIVIEKDSSEYLPKPIRGKIIHSLLEHLNELSNEDISIHLLLEEILDINLYNNKKVDNSEINGIKEIIEKFLQSKICRKILNYNEYYTEFNLNCSINYDFLTGSIDRVCIKNNDILLVDYKTNKISNKSIVYFRKLYEPQMQIYAYLASKYFKSNNIKTVLIFLEKPDDVLIVEYSEEHINLFENTIKSIISEIKLVDIGSKEPSKNISHCFHCDFYANHKCIY